MNKQEFLALDDKAKHEFLNDAIAGGKAAPQLFAEIGIPKEELAHKHGFYLVGTKFMKKPMKGYQTTERSGNEYKDRFK